MRYYRCSDGDTYSGREIWERLEAGVWRPCCWDAETGEEWMESDEGRLLHLDPVEGAESGTDHQFDQIEG